jgi:hypothetical protein
MNKNHDVMIGQLRSRIKKETKIGGLPMLPSLLLMLLPENPTAEDIIKLYLEVQSEMRPSLKKGCPVYNTASQFREQKKLFLALMTYGDEPEVREAIAEERARAHFNKKGELDKEEGGKWPKGSAVTDAMEQAQKRMIKGAKASKEAVAAAKKLRARKIEKLATISAEMESTEALEKVAEYDAALQSLLSDSGKLKHLLRAPSLPEHPKFSFRGGRGPSQTKPSAVSADIS